MTDKNSFQERVQPWMIACFGEEISKDRTERNHRFLEEALELVQATGCTQSEAHQLVDYVFLRRAGEPAQEVGGVMVTLAALCLAQQMDMHEAGETELARIWTKVEQIRAKQAAKPKHSPLPIAVEADARPVAGGRLRPKHIGYPGGGVPTPEYDEQHTPQTPDVSALVEALEKIVKVPQWNSDAAEIAQDALAKYKEMK